MNVMSNIWNQPKTSAAGLLIALLSITGVLSQQGITLGTVGKGNVITLVGGLAAALLGLLAKDPSETVGAQSGGSTSLQNKLGAWALIALLLPLPFVGGCSEATVAQNIVNWTPALQSAVASVDSAGALMSPADAPAFANATTGFDAASNLLAVQAKAYLANPTASTLAQLQNQVVTLQQQVNTALLEAAKIVNPASQQHVLTTIQAVGIVVSSILALVQSVSSKSQVAQMANHSTIKLATVRPYVNKTLAEQMVAKHYGESLAAARTQVAQAEQNEMQAGF